MYRFWPSLGGACPRYKPGYISLSITILVGASATGGDDTGVAMMPVTEVL